MPCSIDDSCLSSFMSMFIIVVCFTCELWFMCCGRFTILLLHVTCIVKNLEVCYNCEPGDWKIEIWMATVLLLAGFISYVILFLQRYFETILWLIYTMDKKYNMDEKCILATVECWATMRRISWNKCTQQIVSKQSLNSFRRLLQSMPT